MNEMIQKVAENGIQAVELLKVHDDSDFPIDGRELHEALGVETPYHIWFPRMCEYGFCENKNYLLVEQKCSTNNPKNPWTTVKNHFMTLSMAKEICMVQRTEIGKRIRQYLISIEEAWNTPEQIMARALKVADETQRKLRLQISHLEADNSRLIVANQIMEPKADYFDALVERNLLTNFRTTAQEFGISQKAFIDFLIRKKFLYRDSRHGTLKPYASKNDGYFEVKEFSNEKTGHVGTQTLITPKGREAFRLMVQGI